MNDHSHNSFNTQYYATIISDALESDYKFVTLSEFIQLGCPDTKHFIIRHDLDKMPNTLPPITKVERTWGVVSTTFVRMTGCAYNAMSYPCFEALREAQKIGCEIGLHSNFVEFANINQVDPHDVLVAELAYMRAFFRIRGIAPHRDIHYMWNSLPWLEENWSHIKDELDLDYHAYEKSISDATIYVNEGLNPHLCWRNLTPHDAIVTGRSIYMLTHPHWWHERHAFEGEL